MSPNKSKKIQIISSSFSDHMKPEINESKKIGKFTNTWKLNYILTKNHWVEETIHREFSNYLGTSENKNNLPDLVGCSKSSTEREVHSGEHLH